MGKKGEMGERVKGVKEVKGAKEKEDLYPLACGLYPPICRLYPSVWDHQPQKVRSAPIGTMPPM